MGRPPVTRISDNGDRFDPRRVAQAFLWPGEAVREIEPWTFTFTDEYVAAIKNLSDREELALSVLYAARSGPLYRRRQTGMVHLLRRDCEQKRVKRYLASHRSGDLASRLYRRVDAILGPTRPVDPRSELCASLKAQGFDVPEIVALLAALSVGRCTCLRPRCGGCGPKRLRARGVEKTDAAAVQRRIDRARHRATRPDASAWLPEERRTVRAAVTNALADVDLSPLETAYLLGILELLDPKDPADAALLALPAVEAPSGDVRWPASPGDSVGHGERATPRAAVGG